MRKERLEAITDAVMAIIITIMALEIELPDLERENIRELFIQIGIYVISYATITIIWINHHHIFKNVETIDHTTLWVNFLLLFTTSLIPLATRTINASFYDYKSHIVYASILFATAVFYSMVSKRAAKISTDKSLAASLKINTASVFLYFAAIPLSFINVYISAAIFIALPTLYFVLPNVRFSRK